MTAREINAEQVLAAIRNRRRSFLISQQASNPPSTAKLEPGTPKVSLIITNYNGARVIERCLRHVLEQDYPNFEVIIVDDASTDTSRAQLSIFDHQPNFQKVLLSKNVGIPGARNAGVEQCTGQIIAFLDNDGYPEPNWLTESVKTLLSSEKNGAVASAVFFSNAPGVVNGFGGFLDRRWIGQDVGFSIPFEQLRCPESVMFPMGCGMLVRRQVLEKIGPFDEVLRRWYDDVELGLKVWRAGFTVAFSPLAIIDHELHVSMEEKLTLRNRVKRPFRFEAARIRIGLKFQPISRIGRWMLAEAGDWSGSLFNKERWRRGVILTLAWLWNVLHLFSVLSDRMKMLNWQGNLEPYLRILALRPPKVLPDSREVKRNNLERFSKKTALGDEGSEVPLLLQFGWDTGEGEKLSVPGKSASAFLEPDGTLQRIRMKCTSKRDCQLGFYFREFSHSNREWSVIETLTGGADASVLTLDVSRFSGLGEIFLEIQTKESYGAGLVVDELTLLGADEENRR